MEAEETSDRLKNRAKSFRLRAPPKNTHKRLCRPKAHENNAL